MRLFSLIVLITLLLAGCSDSGDNSSSIDNSSSSDSSSKIPISMVGEWNTEYNGVNSLGMRARILNPEKPVVTIWVTVTASNGNEICKKEGEGEIITSNGKYFATYFGNFSTTPEESSTREFLSISDETLFVYWNDKVNYTLKRSSIPWFCD